MAMAKLKGFGWLRSLTGRNKVFTQEPHQFHNESASSSVQSGEYGNGDLNFSTYLTSVGHRKATMSDIAHYQEEFNKDDAEMTFSADRPRKPEDPEGGATAGEFEGFGWIKGVWMRCVLCIFGATLFLRMSWMGGQAGIIPSMGVILLSLLIVTITAFSMSAIATNGEIRNGGLYYLISRSLGPEFGGSIGLILWFANTINASMNCVGLAETIVDLLNQNGFKIFDGAINDIRVYGLATCFILQAIIFIGTEFENKTQVLLLITVIVSVGSHIVGSFLPVPESKEVKGLVGYQWSVFYTNLWPSFRGSENFITVFGVYFPAMTGVIAGANMSGDLKDPSSAIPKGTLWGILVTTVTYALTMIITSACTLRDADGTTIPVWNGSYYDAPPCAEKGNCPYGLANDFNVATLQGAWAPLIIAGIAATTLSSASGCLIGGPRVFQALCADKLFPLIEFFAKGHGKSNDPFRAYFLTCAVAAGVILIGDLNAIAVLITNFFLAAFAITNFACFDASAAQSPGFRPGFSYYNKWLSLFGALLCVGTMFALSWITSFITLLAFLVMYIYIKYNKSHINWGSSTEANRYRQALNGLLKITRTVDHVKNYRPQLLVLTGNPVSRQALVDFADGITKGRNLMLCGHHDSSIYATACVKKLTERFNEWLNEKRIRAFYCAVACPSLRLGVQQLLQSVGLGKMQPNIILMGFKSNWMSECAANEKEFEEYVGLLSDAFESNMSVCIFRNEQHGLDHSALLSNDDQLILKLPTAKDFMSSSYNASSASLHDVFMGAGLVAPYEQTRTPNPSTASVRPVATAEQLFAQRVSKSDAKLSNEMDRFGMSATYACRPMDNERFRRKLPNGVVDLWWLFDDGGLELLMAYLLTSDHSYLQGAMLRVFTVCAKKHNTDITRRSVVDMMKKFRIDFSDVFVLQNDESDLYEETRLEYDEMMASVNGHTADPELQRIPADLQDKYSDRTRRMMKHRELLLQYSKASSLVIQTLPLGPPSVVTSPLYMLWLELLSRDLPPTLFVRGNQTSVLTFYS